VLKSSYTACKLIAEEHSFFFYYSTTSELPYLFLYYLSNSRSPPYCKNAKSTFWPRYSQIHMSNHTQCQNKPRSMFLRSATGLFVYHFRCHWHPRQQCPLWWVRVSAYHRPPCRHQQCYGTRLWARLRVICCPSLDTERCCGVPLWLVNGGNLTEHYISHFCNNLRKHLALLHIALSSTLFQQFNRL